MPSIFNRSNPSSKKERQKASYNANTTPTRGVMKDAGILTPDASIGTAGKRGLSGISEFGTMPNLLSYRAPQPPTPPLSPNSDPPLPPPKFTFMPTRIPTHTFSGNSIYSFGYPSDEATSSRVYGLLGGVGSKVILGLDDASQVVKEVAKELDRRGLTTPLLFSNQALELNATRTKMLIQNYVDILRSPRKERMDTWFQDLTYAREYELAWLLRWTLSRIHRTKEGSRELFHGLIEWETYEEWRGRERSSGYPIDAFPFLSAMIPAGVYQLILLPLFTLLSRLTAHSHLSGLTPQALSSLFAALLFDMPTTSTCVAAHYAFVRSACATEHLLLAFIRSSNQKNGLGTSDLPSRLKEWVRGYPTMVASDAALARAHPRRGARTIRCERASRTVRAYSKDLISSAEFWAQDVAGRWEAWDQVSIKSKRGEVGRPKFSTAWRRRLAVKEMLPLPSSSSSPDLSRQMSYGQASRPGSAIRKEAERRNPSDAEEEARWGSLAGKEWSMFEEGGFDAPSLGAKDEMKRRLQFDLTESAKMSISERRQTMEWSDFASPAGGFNRNDPLLDVSLTFSSPLSSSISSWPQERDELRRRLHKAQKDAAPFGFNTTPRVGAEAAHDGGRTDSAGRVWIEEGFLDWWADWGMGGGWMNREELTFKEANWALIEYKARPSKPQDAPLSDPLADPRTSDLYFLFEEKVPTEYQLAVADPKQKKTFASLFSPNKKKRAVTSTPSHVGPGWDDTEFDKMLIHRDRTKKMTLSRSEPPHAAVWHLSKEDPASPPPPRNASLGTTRQRTRSSGHGHQWDSVEDAKLQDAKTSFFSKNKDKVIRRVKTDEETKERVRKKREQEIDFELRSASGVSSPDGSPLESGRHGQGEEKWMDILIANGARRMDRQAAAPTRARFAGPVASGRLTGTSLPRRPQSPSLPTEEIDHFTSHTPDTSGSTEQGPLTPGADVQRHPSWGRRKPVPAIPPTPSPDDIQDEEQRTPVRKAYDSRDLGAPITAPDRGYSPELLQPSPRRDTIHNIVDTYHRDSVLSASTGDFEPHHEYSDLPYDRRSRDSVPHHQAAGESGGKASTSDLGTETGDEGRSDPLGPVKDEGKLDPPGPVFDLTPGREPSPARYKHGEPLTFVGEEDEDEV